ncbi:MAG: TolC family protein, partial [Betaproteobacteria bacterium]|nr:TolC family protein [Betaproteobacteria bacterium]
MTLVAGGASGEDLLQIYREAQASDPQLAAARANWGATQERVPQARAGLLPNVAFGSSVNINSFDSTFRGDPKVRNNNEFGQLGVTISASQPLYRAQSVVALAQAQEQVVQSDYN